MSDYETIIGLEVHVELDTLSKMFCGCPSDHFGKEPNTQTCPVCLGLPGALPVPNKKAVEWTVLLGLALDCEIPLESKFDRKNYFYPDLPKGYQISQYDMPLACKGKLKVKSPFGSFGKTQDKFAQGEQNSKFKSKEEKTIRIRRVHLEEDTGKLQHATVDGEAVSLVDFNRSGVPLAEIVTEPDFRNVEEVDLFLKKLQQIIRYLGISNADMEKGSMRIEPSISILPISNTTNIQFPIPQNKLPKYRVEIKNINSFKFARRAIEYEIERQTEILERGEEPTQQTRGWSEAKGLTFSQREKEEAHDYRYFPEPDIPPIRWEDDQIAKIKTQIGELADAKMERFMKEYALSEYDATILTDTKETAEYFEDCIKQQVASSKHKDITSKNIANWIINKKVDCTVTSPEELLSQISQQSGGVNTLSDDEVKKIIEQVLVGNPKAMEDYKKGKEQALMFLVGLVMREAKGKCSAATVRTQIIEIIKK